MPLRFASVAAKNGRLFTDSSTSVSWSHQTYLYQAYHLKICHQQPWMYLPPSPHFTRANYYLHSSPKRARLWGRCIPNDFDHTLLFLSRPPPAPVMAECRTIISHQHSITVRWWLARSDMTCSHDWALVPIVISLGIDVEKWQRSWTCKSRDIPCNLSPSGRSNLKTNLSLMTHF